MGDRREEILDEYRTRFPSALQAQVNAMAGRMAVLEAEVIKAKARVCAVNANRDAEVSELRKRIAELEAKNAQLSQDRYDALSVTTREGLLCSEWVLRTGKAERERDEARRRIAELEAEVARLGQHVCDECDGSGYYTLTEDGGGPEQCVCPCVGEMQPYQDLLAEVSKARAEEREAIVGMLCKDRDAVLRDDTSKHNTAAVLLDLVHRIQSRAQEGSDG